MPPPVAMSTPEPRLKRRKMFTTWEGQNGRWRYGAGRGGGEGSEKLIHGKFDLAPRIKAPGLGSCDPEFLCLQIERLMAYNSFCSVCIVVSFNLRHNFYTVRQSGVWLQEVVRDGDFSFDMHNQQISMKLFHLTPRAMILWPWRLPLC